VPGPSGGKEIPEIDPSLSLGGRRAASRPVIGTTRKKKKGEEGGEVSSPSYKAEKGEKDGLIEVGEKKKRGGPQKEGKGHPKSPNKEGGLQKRKEEIPTYVPSLTKKKREKSDWVRDRHILIVPQTKEKKEKEEGFTISHQKGHQLIAGFREESGGGGGGGGGGVS